MKITFYTIGTPTVPLGVFIAREISKNLLSTSLGHSLTEFFIPAHVNFFITGHLSKHVSTKNGPTQTLFVSGIKAISYRQKNFASDPSTGPVVIYEW